MPSEYRFSSAFSARVMGGVLVLAGLLVLVAAALVALLDLPSAVLSVVVVLAALGFLVSGGVLVRRPVVVSLATEGYRVRLVRGAGVTAARWKDVEDATTTRVGDQPCVLLRLRDGRTTTLPVGLLAGDKDAFVRDLQQHLEDGHGYRPLA